MVDSIYDGAFRFEPDYHSKRLIHCFGGKCLMPREIRHIMFSIEELELALKSYNRIEKKKLYHGTLTGCQIEPGKGISFTLAEDQEAVGTKTKNVLEFSVLLEPLVRFCIENNIVLPRASNKIVGALKDEVYLKIHFPKI